MHDLTELLRLIERCSRDIPALAVDEDPRVDGAHQLVDAASPNLTVAFMAISGDPEEDLARAHAIADWCNELPNMIDRIRRLIELEAINPGKERE